MAAAGVAAVAEGIGRGGQVMVGAAMSEVVAAAEAAAAKILAAAAEVRLWRR